MQFKKHFKTTAAKFTVARTRNSPRHAFLSDAICLFSPFVNFPPLFASCAYYDKPAEYLSDITRRQINRWCLRFFFFSSSSFSSSFFFITASPRKDIKGNNRSCAVSAECARGTWACRGGRGEVGLGEGAGSCLGPAPGLGTS